MRKTKYILSGFFIILLNVFLFSLVEQAFELPKSLGVLESIVVGFFVGYKLMDMYLRVQK